MKSIFKYLRVLSTHSFLIICIVALIPVSEKIGKTIKVASNTEIVNALKSVQPGDTLVMNNGTWTDAKIVFAANGTSSAPIYLMAETSGQVILTGKSTLRIAGDYLVVKGLFFKDGYSSSGDVIEFRNGSSVLSNYCRLTECAIINYNPSDISKDYKWISLYGTHNRVDHCYVENKLNIGTTLVVWLSATPNYHLIDHNYFAPRPLLDPSLGNNGAETIRVGTSDWSMYDSYTTVEYNLFEKCNGEIEIISNKSCENTYRYNTFVECGGTLTLRHGNRCYVYGNYFIGNHKAKTGGIRIIGEDHKVYNNYLTGLEGTGYSAGISMIDAIPNSPLNGYWQVKNALVLFNTLVDNKNSITIGHGVSDTQNLPPINCTIANNIISSSYSPLIDYEDQPINLKYEGNIAYGASLGIPNPGGITITDPKLLLSSDNLWRIQSNSPAIGAAVGDYNFVNDDFDGQERLSPKDVGCDEYSVSPVVRSQIKKGDVGPGWYPGNTTSVYNLNKIIPEEFDLQFQNYPNPFNPSTNISFIVPEKSYVLLQIFDLKGALIKTLVNEEKSKGEFRISWNAKNLSSGIYISRLIINSKSYTRKMLLLK